MATRDHIYKVSTVKAKTEDESFSAHLLEELEIEYQQYRNEGASSKKKVALSVPAHFPFVPDSTARKAFPRITQLRKMHFVKYGYTLECRMPMAPEPLWTLSKSFGRLHVQDRRLDGQG